MALSGKEILIGRRSKALVRLTPVTDPDKERKGGKLRGRFYIVPDFNELPDNSQDAFNGSLR